jgi:hypothetical protein
VWVDLHGKLDDERHEENKEILKQLKKGVDAVKDGVSKLGKDE